MQIMRHDNEAYDQGLYNFICNQWTKCEKSKKKSKMTLFTLNFMAKNQYNVKQERK